MQKPNNRTAKQPNSKTRKQNNEVSNYSVLPNTTHKLSSSGVITTTQPSQTLPGLFISHGTPQLAIENNSTTHALARIGRNLPKPHAIIIMSAHWVTDRLEISCNPRPQTWHDFSGFDDELHKIDYPTTGHPAFAESIALQLNEMGIANSLNPIRPLDHGVWAPLMHLYPDADVPVIQLSLPNYYDAYACYQLGSIFAQLRQQQILIIGSGSITHNLANMNWHANSEDALAREFKHWLLRCLKNEISAALDWQDFEHATQVHPTPEHLMPLFFALGTGQRVSLIHESMIHHSLGMDIYRFD